MTRKNYFSVFKLLQFFLLTLLLLSLLPFSGCSPVSSLLFGAPGSLEVITYPSGARIFLNGSDSGYLTPNTIPNLPKGTYEVKVVLGELSYTKTVIIYSNNATSVYKDFLLPLNKIVVEPTSMSLAVGATQNITSIIAYYIDLSSVNLALSDCSYSSSSTNATVNSSGTITGVSAGVATITVSYTDLEITKTATIDITVTAATVVNLAAISGVTAPVTGAHPVSNITETAQYTGTITWSGSPSTFAAATIYTATITLIPKTGFTLTGVAANFFTVAGATSDTNPINSGVVTADFPATAAVAATTITAIAAITGTAQVGVELTAGVLTPLAATASYQWQICATSGGTYVSIGGATANKYTPVTGDVTKFIKVVATGTGSYSGTVISAATAAVAPVPLAVGNSYGGGIVAYILVNGDTGYDPNVQHGLIAATADLDSGEVIEFAWSNIDDVEIGAAAQGTAIGTGQANTTAIINQVGHTASAAKLCADYTNTETGTGVYSDWFLPSSYELEKLYLKQETIGGFNTDYCYWSSSEYKYYDSPNYAWIYCFGDGERSYTDKYWDYRVRAVRAF